MAHIYNSQLDAYDLYHQQQEDKAPRASAGPALPALGHALAGSTGTAISNLCIYPLDLIITRLQVQRQLRNASSTSPENEYSGVVDAATKIYTNEGGLAGLYAGVVQDTGKSIADSFLFFLFYNFFRENRLKTHGAKATTLPVLDELAVGAVAGACSKLFTTPIGNIVTRKQTASMMASRSANPSSYVEPSVADIARQIRADKGLLGFWSGYSASLVLTLNPSLTFFFHEFFKRSFLPRAKRENPGAQITFLMAAVSKAMASTITYPFSLAKARAQMSSKKPVDDDIKGKAKASDAGKAALKRSTVFSTVLQIYSEEGLSALYEGVLGEILKGFFSHGITMIVKEAVHKFIIQAYYLILKTLKKLPDPKELAETASDGVKATAGDAYERASAASASARSTAQDAVDVAREKVGQATEMTRTQVNQAVESAQSTAGVVYERAGVIASNASELAKETVGNATEATNGLVQGSSRRASTVASNAGELLNSGANKTTNLAQSGYNRVGESVSDATEAGQAAINTATQASTDAYERAAAAGANASTAAKGLAETVSEKAAEAYSRVTTAATGASAAAGDHASKEAGHLLGNAEEMLKKTGSSAEDK